MAAGKATPRRIQVNIGGKGAACGVLVWGLGSVLLGLAGCGSGSQDAMADAAPTPCEAEGLQMAEPIPGSDGLPIEEMLSRQALAAQETSTLVAFGERLAFAVSETGDIQWRWEEAGLSITSLDTDADGTWLCGDDDGGVRVVRLDEQGNFVASHALGAPSDRCGQILVRGDALYLGTYSFDLLHASLWRMTTSGDVVWEAPLDVGGTPIGFRLDERDGRIAVNVFHAEAPSPRPGTLFLYDTDGTTLWRVPTEGMFGISLVDGFVWGLGRDTLIRFDDQGNVVSSWSLQRFGDSSGTAHYEAMAYDGTTLVVVGGAAAGGGVAIDRSESDRLTLTEGVDTAQAAIYGWLFAWDGTTMSTATLPTVGEGYRLIPRAVALGPSGDIRVSGHYSGTPVFACGVGETTDTGFLLMQVTPEPLQ